MKILQMGYKKVIAIVMILLMVIQILPSYNVIAKDIFSDWNIDSTTKTNYVLKLKDNFTVNGTLNKIPELKEARKIKHKDSDEIYLNKSNTFVASLSQKQLSIVKDLGIFEGIEVDSDLYASNNISDDSDQDMYGVLPDLNTYSNEGTSSSEPEYTSNPEEFIPASAITDESKKTEVLPWNIEMVAGNPAENKYKGEGVKVAVIDSGISMHDDLSTDGWVDFSDYVNGYKPVDNTGHGTEIAGIINARISGFGTIGIAPEADIYSVKVINSNNTTSISSAIKALEWCIDNDIDVVNMSFGMNTYSPLLEKEIKKAYNKGIILVAAAGNTGDKGEVQYPAKYDNVIAVGAVDRSGAVADFSSRGNEIDVVAPGVEAQTTGFVGTYTIVNGTSIAAAHATAVAAVLKGIDRSKTNTFISELMQSTANKVNFEGRTNDYGYGIISLANAINQYYSFNPDSTYETSKNALKTYNETTDYTEENGFLSSSWSANTWCSTIAASGTGHLSMINSMSDTNFNMAGNCTTTEIAKHRSIVAEAAYETDVKDIMGAKGSGNGYRNKDTGAPALSGTYSYSPYHAKTDFSSDNAISLNLAENSHAKFLYELARQRLIKGKAFDTIANNYAGDAYYGVPIINITKRRIVYDLASLKTDLATGGYDVSTTEHQGYMILGVFAHALTDIYAHRAQVPYTMIYTTSTGTTKYSSATYGSSYTNSFVNGFHITKNTTSLPNDLNNGLPIIRLKDYMDVDGFSATINGTSYTNLSANQVYEDCPFFWSNRYSYSLTAISNKCYTMKSDTGDTTTYTFVEFSGIPLK